METMMINHPRLNVRLVTGSEGPSYDPYGFEEYHVTTPENRVVVHLGLAVYATIGEQRIEPETGRDYDMAHTWADRILVDSVGYKLAQLERISRKAKARCPEGGFHDVSWESGYPGETLAWCSKCGKVVDSHFRESAIM